MLYLSFMNSEQLKTHVLEMANELGKERTLKELMNAGISSAISNKLLYGIYKSRFVLETANKVKRVLSKNGFL